MASTPKSLYAPAGRSPAGDPRVGVLGGQAEPRQRLTSILTAGGLPVVARARDADDLTPERADDLEVVVQIRESLAPPSPLRALSRRLPRRPIVVVAPTATHHAARKAIEAGMAGIVLEADAEAALCLAVRSVAAGQLSIPVVLAKGLEKPVLSSREKQVLGMVAMGFTNGQIAGRLFLAESTVKSHLSSIFGKLGVRSRKEAAELVLDPESGFGAGILAMSGADALSSRNGYRGRIAS